MVAPAGHSHHHGPPRLLCSAPWALTQLRTIEPDHPAVLAAAASLSAADRGELTITVDWDELAPPQDGAPAIELIVREQGRHEPVACALMALGEASAVSFRMRAPGTLYIAQLAPLDQRSPFLAWSRALHVLAPFPAAWRNQQSVCFTRLASCLDVSLDELRAMATPIAVTASETASRPLERGFGLELELLSLPPDSERTGHYSKAAELAALLDSAERAAASAPEERERASLFRLVDRVRRWQVSLDPACLPFPCCTAEELLPRMRALGALDDADSLCLLTERARTTPTEYKSGLPPFELCFARNPYAVLYADAATAAARPCASAEAALGLRLIGRLGVCAPSISESGCECNTALHVHVNVRNPQAAGRLLSAREILAVWLAWVRFEHVTARLCRSWCWADRWASPLFATGSEFTFNERPLERGEAAHLERAVANDVPTFFARAHRGVRELEQDEALATGDEAARVAHLFGEKRCQLGKYCSLNLLPLHRYGTLEFRRQHASTDETFIVRWARFCVAFVEAFADERLLGTYMGVEVHAGLQRLQAEQQMATTDELSAALGEYCEPDALTYFRACGCGPHVPLENAG